MQSIKVTTTTTTSSSAGIAVDMGYLRTIPGILKILHLVFGMINIGVIGHLGAFLESTVIFFLLMAVTFFMGSCMLLISFILSSSTASLIRQSVYEFIYHTLAFIFYFSASVAILVRAAEISSVIIVWVPYNEYISAGVFGLILSVLYMGSAVFAYRNYKGL